MENRLDHELAKCIETWGWKYHHLGIPTTEKRQDESNQFMILFSCKSNS